MKYKLRGSSNRIQGIILVHISGKPIWEIFFEQIWNTQITVGRIITMALER